jgi:hypothetical protein
MAKVSNSTPPTDMQNDQTLPPAGWEASLLQQVGAPATAANKQFFDDWYEAEHGPTGYSGGSNGGLNNAFDTTVSGPGSEVMAYGPAHVAGVQEFPTWQVGAAATAQTLEQTGVGPGNNTALLNALKSGNMTVAQLENIETTQTHWGQESGWPSDAVIPTQGTIGSNGLSFPTNVGYGTSTVTGGNSDSGSSTPATSATTPLVTSAPWGGLLGSQIEEAVFFLLGAALVIVGLVITFKSGNEENAVKTTAEHGAELAAA